MNSPFSRLSRLMKNLALDIKFGGRYLGWKVGNGDERRGYVSSQPSNYDALEILFSKVTLRPDDVIVDVGCGQGRPFNWLLSQGVKNKLIGVDIDPAVARQTRERLATYPQVEIVVGNVEEGVLPPTGTVFYLFNPFSARVVEKFEQQVATWVKEGQFKAEDRPIIVYYNSTALHLFENNPIWKIKNLGSITHMHLEAAIIEPQGSGGRS